jgi:RNA polymerase sigma factor (sigma-70 family)
VSPWFSDALLRAQTDERLVALVRDGHDRAFVAIVERYRRPLLAFTCRLVPDARAEDVLQQAFLNAWAALGRDAEVRHLRGWLHQIVRNAALAARMPAEDPLPESMIDDRDTPSHVEERLLIAQTLENLAALPEHQRQAIVKTAMEGRSREDVASSLGVTEGAVRAMLHRARATLRAAATAVTPLPLAVWAAGSGGMSVAERTADVAAGTGAAGLAAAAAKAGTVVAVTGAVATTVAGDRLPLMHRYHTPTQAASARPHERKAMASVVRRAPTSAPVRSAAPAVRAPVRADSPRRTTFVRARTAPPPRPVGRTLVTKRDTVHTHDDASGETKAPPARQMDDRPADEQRQAVVADNPDEQRQGVVADHTDDQNPGASDQRDPGDGGDAPPPATNRSDTQDD